MSQIPSAASLRARRADDHYDRCPECHDKDVSGVHVDRCEEKAKYLRRVINAAAEYDVPEVTARDLYAHAVSRCHNELVAVLLVEAVLDLGWRPVVGSDPKRLWEKPEPML